MTGFCVTTSRTWWKAKTVPCGLPTRIGRVSQLISDDGPHLNCGISPASGLRSEKIYFVGSTSGMGLVGTDGGSDVFDGQSFRHFDTYRMPGCGMDATGNGFWADSDAASGWEQQRNFPLPISATDCRTIRKTPRYC